MGAAQAAARCGRPCALTQGSDRVRPGTARGRAFLIRAIFFDLDDTLVEDTLSLERCAEAAVLEISPALRLPANKLAIAYVDSAIDFWESLEPGAPPPKAGDIRPSMWRAALRRYGVDDADLAARIAKRYDQLRIERVELFPEAVKVLQALHGKYKMAIITNGFAETHDVKIARLELSRFFDHVILAGEMQLVKPDPKIFEHAMTLVGVTPGESVMVGDRFNRDIAGAHAAGMRAIWVNVRDETAPAGVRPADATILSIGELPTALAALA
ncbi:MAG: HAD family hydrolase [Candidatus Eremiobacteraeota bacterium]|nr:HAD family hydrolase [Candidatus Eremiobacteraeota bacterium]